jgi:transposase InsO family protein
MSLRRLIVEVELEGLNVRRFCVEHGISTWLFYELRRRFAAGGVAAIEPRSRAPGRVANRTPGGVEDAIVVLRKQLLEAGLDAGPATIRFHLAARSRAAVPSESTIWRVLTRRGFITADPSKAPTRPSGRFAAARANECWQTDETSWALADGTAVKIINIVDDCTRVATASRAVPHATASALFETFAGAAGEWGWPEWVLCDNATAHRHGLTHALGELGIATGHSRPYHPQTCGKVERFHQTLKRYLNAHDPAARLSDLQTQLDTFCRIYNHQRPHRSLGRRIPAHIWATTPKSGPANRSLSASTQIHRVTTDRHGVWVGRRYSISLGAAYKTTPAIVIITGTACHVFVDGRLARKLTLDPTRRYQPLHNRPARPPHTVSDAPRHP